MQYQDVRWEINSFLEINIANIYFVGKFVKCCKVRDQKSLLLVHDNTDVSHNDDNDEDDDDQRQQHQHPKVIENRHHDDQHDGGA